MDKEKIKGIEDYQYGFADKDTSIYKTKQAAAGTAACQ